MKKFILVAVVVLVAIVGLTSYNGREEKKSEKNDVMLAMVRTSKGEPSIPTTTTVGTGTGTIKKD